MKLIPITFNYFKQTVCILQATLLLKSAQKVKFNNK